MKSDFIILTNNPKVYSELKKAYDIEFNDGDYMQVLKSARDYIHAGHTLLTHPLAGSIKPNETPYKSIMLTKDKQGLDSQSVRIIEDSIHACEKFSSINKELDQEVIEDFRHVDYSLIESAIASAVV